MSENYDLTYNRNNKKEKIKLDKEKWLWFFVGQNTQSS